MKPLEYSASCFCLPTVASASLGDVLRRPFCRFASLRGGTTKQSRPRIEKKDCFTAFANALHSTESKTRIESTVDCFVPRNDAKRVWGRSPKNTSLIRTNPQLQLQNYLRLIREICSYQREFLFCFDNSFFKRLMSFRFCHTATMVMVSSSK